MQRFSKIGHSFEPLTVSAKRSILMFRRVLNTLLTFIYHTWQYFNHTETSITKLCKTYCKYIKFLLEFLNTFRFYLCFKVINSVSTQYTIRLIKFDSSDSFSVSNLSNATRFFFDNIEFKRRRNDFDCCCDTFGGIASIPKLPSQT